MYLIETELEASKINLKVYIEGDELIRDFSFFLKSHNNTSGFDQNFDLSSIKALTIEDKIIEKYKDGHIYTPHIIIDNANIFTKNQVALLNKSGLPYNSNLILFFITELTDEVIEKHDLLIDGMYWDLFDTFLSSDNVYSVEKAEQLIEEEYDFSRQYNGFIPQLDFQEALILSSQITEFEIKTKKDLFIDFTKVEEFYNINTLMFLLKITKENKNDDENWGNDFYKLIEVLEDAVKNNELEIDYDFFIKLDKLLKTTNMRKFYNNKDFLRSLKRIKLED